jgi:hypothetical protein
VADTPTFLVESSANPVDTMISVVISSSGLVRVYSLNVVCRYSVVEKLAVIGGMQRSVYYCLTSNSSTSRRL